MTPSTRETVLFWCQVGLYISAMVTLLGILVTLWFFTVAQMHTLSQNQERDKALLQQHATELQQHHEAMQDHRAVMERLRQP